MKIALVTHAGEHWKAGATILASLLQSLRGLGDQSPELAVVIWEGTSKDQYPTTLSYVDETISAPIVPPPEGELAYLSSLRSHLAWWVASRVLRRPAHNPLFYSDALRRHAVNCAISMPLERRPDFGVPLIVWIPDLQHRALPDAFSLAERAGRDRWYRSEMAAATLVWVTADSVRHDIAAFAPEYAAKVRVVPPIAPVPPAIYDQDPAGVLSAYHLPARFFVLPNQFWAHKNHMVVLEALRLLQTRSVYPTVVCTGLTADSRSPLHFVDLLNKISAWNLREQFLLLGLVPYEQVLALVRQSVCVLNPSLFEGFGFSVAESISLGKRALASDLPAHREQNPPGALYFNPRDPHELADKMELVWNTAEPGPDLAREAVARAEWPKRQLEFGRACLQLVNEAVALGKTRSEPASQEVTRQSGL